MANLNKGNNGGSFAAPTKYDHGAPQVSGGYNNGGNGGNGGYGAGSGGSGGAGGFGGNGGNGGYGGGYDQGQTYGEYVEPEIYESGYDGFRSPQPQTQKQYDDRGFAKNPGYGTGYADRTYSNQQFETMGGGSNSPYANPNAFDPQMNNGAYSRGQPQPQPQPNVMPNYGNGQPQQQGMHAQKYCKWCASGVAYDAVICPKCGRQIEELKQAGGNMGMPMNYGQPQVIINNSNNNVANPYGYVPPYGLKDKGVALLLSFFFGWFGAHKFYEGKIIMGLIYLFTFGLFGIGNLIDFLVLLGKPRKYLP